MSGPVDGKDTPPDRAVGGTVEPAARASFVRARTRLQRPAVVPELELHLADDMDQAWGSVQRELDDGDLPPPFWAFAWLGGQAVARHVLDVPDLVRGRRVLDLAAGSGVCALAARLAGAAQVLAVDTDPFAVAAVQLNAAVNAVEVQACCADPLDAPPPPADVVLAGDVFYDAAMAERVQPWLLAARAGGARVIVGDPGRHYLPRRLLTELASYDIPTTCELEGVELKRVQVYELTAAATP